MNDVSDEVVQRMVRFVRHMAEKPVDERLMGYEASFAREIAALLPIPVDPDLIEARNLVHARSGDLAVECGYRSRVIDRLEDDHPAIVNTLAAIKRGRELERSK